MPAYIILTGSPTAVVHFCVVLCAVQDFKLSSVVLYKEKEITHFKFNSNEVL